MQSLNPSISHHLPLPILLPCQLERVADPCRRLIPLPRTQSLQRHDWLTHAGWTSWSGVDWGTSSHPAGCSGCWGFLCLDRCAARAISNDSGLRLFPPGSLLQKEVDTPAVDPWLEPLSMMTSSMLFKCFTCEMCRVPISPEGHSTVGDQVPKRGLNRIHQFCQLACSWGCNPAAILPACTVEPPLQRRPRFQSHRCHSSQWENFLSQHFFVMYLGIGTMTTASAMLGHSLVLGAQFAKIFFTVGAGATVSKHTLWSVPSTPNNEGESSPSTSVPRTALFEKQIQHNCIVFARLQSRQPCCQKLNACRCHLKFGHGLIDCFGWEMAVS